MKFKDEKFIVKKYSERLHKIFRIYNTIEEEYVKIGECNDLLCSSKEEAQAECDRRNR